MAPQVSKEVGSDSSDFSDSGDGRSQLRQKEPILKKDYKKKPEEKREKQEKWEKKEKKEKKGGKDKSGKKDKKDKEDKEERKERKEKEKRERKERKEKEKVEKEEKEKKERKENERREKEEKERKERERREQRKKEERKAKEEKKESQRTPSLSSETSDSSSDSCSSESDSFVEYESPAKPLVLEQIEKRAAAQKENPFAKPNNVPEVNSKPRFVAPRGFRRVDTPASRSTDLLDTFSGLQGKELWYIIAPAAAPVETIKEISMDVVGTGLPVIRQNGMDYSIKTVPPDLTRPATVLVRGKDENTYHNVPLSISRNYKLVEHVDTWSMNYLKTLKQARAKKPKIQNPKHLRMRYRPYPSGPGSPIQLESSSESEAEGATSKAPRGSRVEQEGKKRKRKETNESAENREGKPQVNSAELPRKKSKKHHLSHDDEKLKTPHKSRESSQPAACQEEPKKSKKSRKDSEKQSEENGDGSKARKEEKKRKKQEKTERQDKREKRRKTNA